MFHRLSESRHRKYVKKRQARHLLENPIKPGFRREYLDHNGRRYQDVPIPVVTMTDLESQIADVMAQQIQQEIDREIVDGMHTQMIDDLIMQVLAPVA